MPYPDRASAAPLRRRHVLALPLATVLGDPLWAQNTAPKPAGGRFVMVFLRGAMDGLSAFVPHTDPHYRQLRSGIAIAAPDGSADTALMLDSRFALHPALAPLLPLWQQGVFSFIPTVGLPQPNRSHFDAQHVWETGRPLAQKASAGWLNRWASWGAGVTPAEGRVHALGVGENNPDILRGPAAVKLVPQGQAALRAGALSQGGTRQALQDLYANDPALGAAFARGSSSRLDTARELQAADANTMAMAGTRGDMEAASNGAPNVAGLALDAKHLATLMNNDPRLRIGFLSAGGWDTHAGQGSVRGNLAVSLGKLAQALVELRRGFSRPDDVVVVVSEFGRTCAENGTGGTDHGYGNAMMLMGNRIQGGRWHGRWEGLAPDRLNENRDLPVFHDFRAVLALVLRATQGVDDHQLAALFPDSPYTGSALLNGDNRALGQLLRA